jgi:PAS domain S-box-containing protein
MDNKRATRALPTTGLSGSRARYNALRFAALYAALGAVWIVFSDQIVDWLTDDETSRLFAQTVKGILYVAVTTVLVYVLALRAFRHIEYKAATRQLDDTQHLLDAVLGNLGEAILLIDPSTRTITKCNEAATEVFGYSESELLGQSTLLLHVDEESHARFGEIGEPELERNNVFRFQYPMKRKDGTVIDTEVIVVTLHRDAGWRTGVVSIIRDISERARAYRALEASENRYRILAENTLDVIWSMDTNLTFTYVNPAVFQVTGHTPDEVLGTCFDEYFDDHHLPELKRIIANEIEKGPGNTGILVDTEILRKDGSKVPVEINGKVLFNSEGIFIGLQGSTRNISERLNYEAQLRQSQKMEAIGTLAAGIAHEVNNPIASVGGFAQLISQSEEVPENFRRFATNIYTESARISEIVKNLLGYARIEDEQVPSPITLHEVVDSTLSLVRGVLRHDHIVLQVSVEDDLPSFSGRRQQVQQVLMNLLTNARDALNARFPDADDDKLLLISTTVVRRDNADWVRLTVEDHGAGIPHEVQERVFDPFYTTKPTGKGTGLGLWLVYSIVEKHQGHIGMESQPGAYTRFHVEFPVCEIQTNGGAYL